MIELDELRKMTQDQMRSDGFLAIAERLEIIIGQLNRFSEHYLPKAKEKYKKENP